MVKLLFVFDLKGAIDAKRAQCFETIARINSGDNRPKSNPVVSSILLVGRKTPTREPLKYHGDVVIILQFLF